MIITPGLVLLLTGVTLSSACQSHDKACVGTHGTQGNCCDNLYCHKGDATWAEGRCYFKTEAVAGPVTCVGFDGACTGDHGTAGNCCSPRYCHKNDLTWAQGRCYNPVPVPGAGVVVPPAAPISTSLTSPVVGSPVAPQTPVNGPPVVVPVAKSCVDHDEGCLGIHGTQGNCCSNLYCHRSNPAWLHGRCYFTPVANGVNPALAAKTCVDHDEGCLGLHGTQGDCCPGLYCHKSNPVWLHGRCYFNPLAGQSIHTPSSSSAAVQPSVGVPVSVGPSVSQSAPVVAPAPTTCKPQDDVCIGDPGTRGDCCDAFYCHKDDASWIVGRCRPNPVI